MPPDRQLYRIDSIGEIATNVRTSYVAPPHSHDTYSIGIFQGAARIWCRDREWHVGAGQVVILEPGEAHRGSTLSSQCSQTMILPNAGFMEQVFGCARPFCFLDPVIDDPTLGSLLSDSAARGDAEGLSLALCRLFRRYGEAEPLPLAGAEHADWMAVAGSIAAASRHNGVSRFHFSRTLKALTGLSPRDLRRQQRVARARLLIEQGEALATAALRSGFSDQAHMTRHLRSLLGVTPSALRRR